MIDATGDRVRLIEGVEVQIALEPVEGERPTRRIEDRTVAGFPSHVQVLCREKRCQTDSVGIDDIIVSEGEEVQREAHRPHHGNIGDRPG
ncbi:hypothetical protein ACFJGV_10075 [Cnuibacter sp. UC19_7]|uniref:hypothetical protein n=1 Tax=Cnuibacter sp. UC19_7 TaxID=3350166 RepID=UPI0036713106